MERDGFECSECAEKTKPLSVHHLFYITGRHPWMYPNWSLNTLCEDCHKYNHDEVKEKSKLNDLGEHFNPDTWETIVSFLGIEKISDFEIWWDFAAELKMKGDYFKSIGKRPVDWCMWAIEEMSRQDYLLQLPSSVCKACNDPMPNNDLPLAHTCSKNK